MYVVVFFAQGKEEKYKTSGEEVAVPLCSMLLSSCPAGVCALFDAAGKRAAIIRSMCKSCFEVARAPSAGALWVAMFTVQGCIHHVLGNLRSLPGQRIVGCGCGAVLFCSLGDSAQPRKAEQPGAAGAARPGRQGLISLRLQRLARKKCRGFSGHEERRGASSATCQAPGGLATRGVLPRERTSRLCPQRQSGSAKRKKKRKTPHAPGGARYRN